MSSKSRNDRKIVPLLTGPVPVGTPLYRALQEVARCVAEELAKQQTCKPDRHNAASDDVHGSQGDSET